MFILASPSYSSYPKFSRIYTCCYSAPFFVKPNGEVTRLLQKPVDHARKTRPSPTHLLLSEKTGVGEGGHKVTSYEPSSPSGGQRGYCPHCAALSLNMCASLCMCASSATLYHICPSSSSQSFRSTTDIHWILAPLPRQGPSFANTKLG